MRFRAVVLVGAVACFSQAIPVEAARPRRAIRPYHYTDENHHVGTPVNGAGVWNTEDAYAFPLRTGEKAVEVMVLDDNERPVSAEIVQIVWDYQEGGASVGHAVTHVQFCGQTEAPVPVQPDITVEIFLRKGTCQDGTPSLPVEGDIVVDFFKS
jgi:hypothetical protein